MMPVTSVSNATLINKRQPKQPPPRQQKKKKDPEDHVIEKIRHSNIEAAESVSHAFDLDEALPYVTAPNDFALGLHLDLLV